MHCLYLPCAAWDAQRVKGTFIPNFFSTRSAALMSVPRPSPHCTTGVFSGEILRTISFSVSSMDLKEEITVDVMINNWREKTDNIIFKENLMCKTEIPWGEPLYRSYLLNICYFEVRGYWMKVFNTHRYATVFVYIHIGIWCCYLWINFFDCLHFFLENSHLFPIQIFYSFLKWKLILLI